LQISAKVGAVDRKLALTLGATCALAAAAGAVLLTLAEAGRGAVGVSSQSGGPPLIEVSASPDSRPSPAAVPSAAAVTPSARPPQPVVLAAEAQVLGVKPKDLAAQLTQGTTVHQLAGQKAITQPDFQTRYAERLRAILDQQVRNGRLTRAQEQQAMQRLGVVPNWDGAPAPQP